ncbi:hypothetical protein KQI61_01505 [Anaerocolumna aminovalerica]|uniref:hypothetical protein n=1 Tax=Anaerocolumna aminovalerica TaxID=1527 RepID=UPI001C0EF162|nr:hypothetical protein [Anaerocolumna aminovalerica]MBU5330862.1 hypothetical protein [Anaerocolumna aminovalerica]
MRKLSVCVLIMLLFVLTSCNSNTINDDTSSTPVIPELENSEDIKDEKNDSNNDIELSGDNRTHLSTFNNNSLILPYGRLDSFSYSNYQQKTMDIPETKFYEFINEIETSFFYDSSSQLAEVNPSFSGGTNLGTIIYFTISNDEYETQVTISATSNNKIFISIDTGSSENYQTYVTINDKLLEKFKDISGWRQVDPNQIDIQKLATTYFEVDEILSIKQGETMEYEHYILDTTEFSLLLKQFSDEKKADGSEIMERDAIIEMYLEDGTICYCVVDLYTGLLALEQQLYQFDDDFKFIFTNIINTKK